MDSGSAHRDAKGRGLPLMLLGMVVALLVVGWFIAGDDHGQRATETSESAVSAVTSVASSAAREREAGEAADADRGAAAPALRPQPSQAPQQPSARGGKADAFAERKLQRTPDAAVGEDVSNREAEPAEMGEQMVWSLDTDGIRAAVAELQPEILRCYEAWQKLHQNMAGKLVVRFVVTPDEASGEGRVSEAGLQHSDLEHPFMEGCVLRLFQELRFEKPDGPRLDVSYPLLFSKAAAPDPERE